MINIAELLKDAPKGMKLYSPMFGEVFLYTILSDSKFITVRTADSITTFNEFGQWGDNSRLERYPDAECLLFPSKDCRTWEGWKAPVKPKFKVGDWIVFNGLTLYIEEIIKGYYRTISKGGITNSYGWDIDNLARLWTIKDSIVGDVLANDHHILILKELDYDWYTNGTPYSVHAYCGIKPNGNFELGKEHWCFCGTLHMRPATSKERSLLFAKMREAGYEWDEKKKELKKITE